MSSKPNTQSEGLDKILPELKNLKTELDDIIKPVIADYSSPAVEYVIEQAYGKDRGFEKINSDINDEFENPPPPTIVGDIIRHTPEFVADDLGISVDLAKTLISVRYRLNNLGLEKGKA